MTFQPTTITGLTILDPAIFYDERGYFFETYHLEKLREGGIEDQFVQDNQSLSKQFTLRGLHFQAPPFAQAKLVRVIQGSVLDVAVDIRLHSPTYGQHVSVVLSAENHRQLYIPEGFAHGFMALEDHTILSYKCSQYYNRPTEGGLVWNDPRLGIAWGEVNPLVSAKDQVLPWFDDFQTPFTSDYTTRSGDHLTSE